MKIKEMVKTKKQQLVIAGAAIAVMGAAGILAACYFLFGGNGNGNEVWGGGMPGGVATGGNVVSAYGLTGIGMTQENFEVENLETKLLIEEVYISSDEEIEEGTAVLKLSEDTIAEARAELEKALRQAELDYRAGVIGYEQSVITAEYDRDSALLAGKQAQAVYEATVSNLNAGVEKAEKDLKESKEQIAEYQEAVESSSYYDYYRVGEYQELYEENKKLLMDKMEEWGVSWSQITGSGSGNAASMSAGQSSGAGGTVSGGNAGGAGNTNILSSLYRVLEQNLSDSEQAESDYKEAALNAEFELQTLQLNLSALEKALTEAKEKYETQLLQAKLARETALSGAERAESDYATALEKAESDLETLKDARDAAETNLALFESSVGDGYYYAAGSGTVLRAMVRARQELVSDATIFLYSNPEEMSVTASVDQADIAKLAVGDSAQVVSADYGSFEGIITAIDPVTSSEGRTNVTYQVTVMLNGDTGSLPANKTVTVLFDMGGEA